MPTESIVFAPELDERQLGNETDKVNEELQQVGEGIPVDFEGDMEGLTDGLEVPGGGPGGGVPGGAGAAAGLASKIPKPVAGVAASAALPVALAGGIGVGLLSAMSEASAQLSTSASILGTAKDNFFRAPGDLLDQKVARPIAKEVLGISTQFEENAREQGVGFAVGSAAASGTQSLGEGIVNQIRTDIENQASRGIGGQLQSLAGPVGEIAPSIAGGAISGATGQSPTDIKTALSDALPTASGVTAATTLPVSLSGSTGLDFLSKQDDLGKDLGIISSVMQFAESNLWEPLSGATDDITNFFSDPASLIGFDGSGESPFADLDISESDILDDVFDTVTNSNLVSSVFDTVTSNSLVNSVFNTVGSNTLVGSVFNTVTSGSLIDRVFSSLSPSSILDTVFSKVQSKNIIDRVFSRIQSVNILDRLFTQIPSNNIIDTVFSAVPSSDILSIFPDVSLPTDFWPDIPTPSFDVDPPELPDNFWPEISFPTNFWPDLAPDDVDFDIPVPEDLWPELSLPTNFWPDISFPDNLWPDLSVPTDFWPDMAVPDIDIPRAELPDNFWPDVDAPELDVPDFPGWPDLDYDIPEFPGWPDLDYDIPDFPSWGSFVPDLDWSDFVDSFNPLSGSSTNTVGAQNVESASSGGDNRDILRQIESNTRSDAQSSQNLATIESQLSQLQSEVKRLRSAMDITVQVGREEIARATQEGRQNGTTDTDPTV